MEIILFVLIYFLVGILLTVGINVYLIRGYTFLRLDLDEWGHRRTTPDGETEYYLSDEDKGLYVGIWPLALFVIVCDLMKMFGRWLGKVLVIVVDCLSNKFK